MDIKTYILNFQPLVAEAIALPIHVRILGILIAVLFFGFLIFFLLRGLAVRWKLSRVISRLRSIRKPSIDALASVFKTDRVLAHLWQEYKETLHEQRQPNPAAGAQQAITYRSTLPAEVFFNTQVLIDSRLRTEFFKHLPGIFTGLGIIGTFVGLIRGLQAFQVSEVPTVVRDSLNTLLHGVWEAFVVSAIAIALAMVVTVFEKLLLASLYVKIQAIAQALDGLFEAGAGEEYLSRLVRASEDSASQTKILKDALVTDLKQILTELTERQIEATRVGTTQLAEKITGTLQSGLQEPLDRIASAVTQVSRDQSGAVTQLLTDVLSGFSQKLQDLFGDQIGGINRMQQQTIDALNSAVGALQQMVSNVEATGRSATDSMASKLTEAISAMEARQQILNERMAAFVEQIRTAVDQSQSESNSKLQAMLSELGMRMGELVDTLGQQVEKTAAASLERESKVVERTEQTISEMGNRFDDVLAALATTTNEIRVAVGTMQATTTEAVSKMNSSAETLYIAASDFAKAGQSVSGALTKAEEVSSRLSQVAGSIANATGALEGVLSDYRAARDAVSGLVTVLERTVETARREVAMTEDVVKRIEDAAIKLSQAQLEADRYLEAVSQVLAEGHEAFAVSIKKTLSEANTQFYDSLSKATSLLREGIAELETTLSAVTPNGRTQ
jgi:hypothetical protein